MAKLIGTNLDTMLRKSLDLNSLSFKKLQSHLSVSGLIFLVEEIACQCNAKRLFPIAFPANWFPCYCWNTQVGLHGSIAANRSEGFAKRSQKQTGIHPKCNSTESPLQPLLHILIARCDNAAVLAGLAENVLHPKDVVRHTRALPLPS